MAANDNDKYALTQFFQFVYDLVTDIAASLVLILTRIPASLGQKTKAGSFAVTIASDQTPPLFVTKTAFLLNGASKTMSVNGSVTPVNFTLTPGAGEVFYIDNMVVFLTDSGSMDYTDFGSIVGPLANGLLVDAVVNGIAHTIGLINDNVDLTMHFQAFATPPSGSTNGFLNDNDFYSGMLQFKQSITLNNATGDFIRIQVRDNLTLIGQLQALVQYSRTP